MTRYAVRVVFVLVFAVAPLRVSAQAPELIPHGQSMPPGPALSPQEAIAKMTVPEGFSVELVASEPDLVNPVAMTFDERGRVWITESFEYPRREAGPGRDRVKVLEDTDGDGRADKFTIFAEGLNIPSGIAVGAGGVWVANAPDILFLQDTDGDGKADRREVVVTGFGRDDTHELPNSLTWGPDGWLYGLNGVFNHSHVEHQGRVHDFTCALFRIHPRTREFELFAEGTSNPWGVAWDNEGSAFLSACVIDHLWHLTENGYYHRQGGPYPPFTWKLDSIVDHKHQKAAYCGIHFFDSDAYPEPYRERLYMGNIHGNCVNSDRLLRDGATYRGLAEPDFLSANDAWFMPVVQKTGPDGCLYVLDWYDRYHCYQDARRDPQGIDRLKGRLYRVRYHDTPHAAPFDMAAESDDQLIERLFSPNVYYRDIAGRLLWERNRPATREKLERLVLDESQPRKARMHALWALVGCGPLDATFHLQLLASGDAGFRAWGVRAAGNMHQVDATVAERIAELVRDPSPDVQVQVAIAAKKLASVEPLERLIDVLAHGDDAVLLPHIVWQNLHPLLAQDGPSFVRHLERLSPEQWSRVAGIVPRSLDRLLALEAKGLVPSVALVRLAVERGESGAAAEAAAECLATLAVKSQQRELSAAMQRSLQDELAVLISGLLSGSVEHPLYLDGALLASTWKDPRGTKAVANVLASKSAPAARRLQALGALVAARDAAVLDAVENVLSDSSATPLEFRRRVLDAVGRLDDPRVADVVLARYSRMEPELRPQAVELLTSRKAWAKSLVDAVDRKQVEVAALNVNQVRKMLALGDADLKARVEATWGTLRTERNPMREHIIAEMRRTIRSQSGDAIAGAAIFKKVCGQCHKIYGEGPDVGPDITLNGRNSFEQLLSNVFDPSLVIGADYRAHTVVTADGRILTGLVAEDSQQRVVLKVQGGKLETIARADVEQMVVSELSMMPEDLEKQIKPQEMIDLFAYLTLDKPPSDPAARRLPGVDKPLARESDDPTQFSLMIEEVAPGFSMTASGPGGVAVLDRHMGHETVVRTHPLDRDTPCVLSRTVEVPASGKTRLVLDVSHYPGADWMLVVRADGKVIHQSVVGPETTQDGWTKVRVDLARFAGKTVALEVLNQANKWADEYAYWGRVEIVSK